MSDLKRTVRDTEADMKEAWRKADGDESLGDKAANVGDRLENDGLQLAREGLVLG